MRRRSLFRKSLLLTGCMTLAACQTTGTTPKDATNTEKIDAALERAAASAAEQGQTGQSQTYLEKIYKRNSSDPQAAINYAASLREQDYLNQAALVLAPFAKDAKSPAQAKTEYAAIQLALGNTKSAEQYAQKAVIQNPDDYKAFHYLGIALDAQGMHKEAERAFRKSLDHWQGDPTPVMNNLALNLAAQNYLDEAVEILRKAKAIAPERLDVERNLRIVTTLQQSAGRDAPKPRKKPVVADAPVVPVAQEKAAAPEPVKPEQKAAEAPKEIKPVEKVTKKVAPAEQKIIIPEETDPAKPAKVIVSPAMTIND